MGVTLERVQFKFASIIGELCSEPKILSQFAVWLDMRLAEFKLKGSISLDCSGEPVPPEWMQGMGEVMAANAVHKGKSESAAPQSTDYVKHDDDIIIEDSQMSDSIHTAESFQSNCTRTTDMSRKRANIQWQEDQFKYTPKSARYLADDTDTERNQSLMSIITETADSETSFQNPLSNDVSSFNMTDAGSTKDFQEGSKLSQYSYPTQSSDQSTSGTQLNSNISVYHQGTSFQRRERSVWSAEERCAIHSNLLPIVRRTRKPPTKADIQALMLREPALRNRHWEKIKFQAWSLYQTLVRRQNNRRKGENTIRTSEQTLTVSTTLRE